MKRYLFITLGVFFGVRAPIDTINTKIDTILRDLDSLKKTNVATVEEVEGIDAKLKALSDDVNTIKKDTTKKEELAADKNKPKELYQHCICTHYETGGTLRMHNYGKSCYMAGGYIPASACRSKSTTSSPDLQVFCRLVTTNSPLPPAPHACSFFNS